MPQMAAKDYACLTPTTWAAARQADKPEKKDRERTKASELDPKLRPLKG